MDMAHETDKKTIRAMLMLGGWTNERIDEWEKTVDEAYPEWRDARASCPSGSVAVWKEEVVHE
jgi:hypothetical protein